MRHGENEVRMQALHRFMIFFELSASLKSKSKKLGYVSFFHRGSIHEEKLESQRGSRIEWQYIGQSGVGQRGSRSEQSDRVAVLRTECQLDRGVVGQISSKTEGL